jgi:integrase/recombinase XerD
MALGKQAKLITPAEFNRVVRHIDANSRQPVRDRLMMMLNHKAGLRAKEIAGLTWSMVTDASGEIADTIELPNTASKGKGGGRTIPLATGLRDALMAWQAEQADRVRPDRRVMRGQRGDLSAQSVTNWFFDLYKTVGLKGASSHSGRRSFCTKAAHKVVEAGGSLRDVQQLMGHASLQTTQRYVEGNSDAKRKLMSLI